MSMAPAPPSRTVSRAAPEEDGFCQVASRSGKPVSATPVAPVDTARRSGGRAVQAAGRAPAPTAGAASAAGSAWADASGAGSGEADASVGASEEVAEACA
ncbi:hypothetical protein ACIQM4_30160 [Streptomyces sp. NPDC091272]|uniref:hypothetical protein n=1 Tax=Streptomyces sp. NPDC091272 TaxID=3365981 RepID=UPI0037F2591E